MPGLHRGWGLAACGWRTSLSRLHGGLHGLACAVPVAGALSHPRDMGYMARRLFVLWTVTGLLCCAVRATAPRLGSLPSRARHLPRRVPVVARSACCQGRLPGLHLSSYVGCGFRRVAPASPHIDVPHVFSSCAVGSVARAGLLIWGSIGPALSYVPPLLVPLSCLMLHLLARCRRRVPVVAARLRTAAVLLPSSP